MNNLVLSQGYSPFVHNYHTMVAIAQENFALVMVGTWNHESQYKEKLYELSPKLILGMTGRYDVIQQFVEEVEKHLELNQILFERTPPMEQIAEMLSVIKESEQFSWAYLKYMLVGLDGQGKGVIHSYEPLQGYNCTTSQTGGTPILLKDMVLEQSLKRSSTVTIKYISHDGIQTDIFQLFD